jgi:hypothetical protein
MDYHDFPTTPILRQTLTLIVPEYDQVAPVLAKPVRPGLHSLAQGSHLQAFALTIGIGRLAEIPVDQAISVLLKSDADGLASVREALKSWSLSLRRRISARFWRAQRDERGRQITEKAMGRRQSHKYRQVHSNGPACWWKPTKSALASTCTKTPLWRSALKLDTDDVLRPISIQ